MLDGIKATSSNLWIKLSTGTDLPVDKLEAKQTIRSRSWRAFRLDLGLILTGLKLEVSKNIWQK